MADTAADVLIEGLIDWGVDTVFGIPGDGINGIMEALRTRRDRVRFVQVRHEEAAAFMACAYAKYTGRLGCCLATSGPGGIHLLNGLYDASRTTTRWTASPTSASSARGRSTSTSRVSTPELESLDGIPLGHGEVVEWRGERVAVYKDDRGPSPPARRPARTWAASSAGTAPSGAGTALATARASTTTAG